jgi:hypothetical protein
MLHHMVLVLAVLVQASEGPRNHHTRGEREGTTMNVKFIVSVGSGSPCNFLSPLHFVPVNCIMKPCDLMC